MPASCGALGTELTAILPTDGPVYAVVVPVPFFDPGKDIRPGALRVSSLPSCWLNTKGRLVGTILSLKARRYDTIHVVKDCGIFGRSELDMGIVGTQEGRDGKPHNQSRGDSDVQRNGRPQGESDTRRRLGP